MIETHHGFKSLRGKRREANRTELINYCTKIDGLAAGVRRCYEVVEV